MSDPQLFGRLDGKPRIGAPSRRWQARLSDDEVRHLRRMRADGYRYIDLARVFNISPSACHSVVNRLTYKHVK